MIMHKTVMIHSQIYDRKLYILTLNFKHILLSYKTRQMDKTLYIQRETNSTAENLTLDRHVHVVGTLLSFDNLVAVAQI